MTRLEDIYRRVTEWQWQTFPRQNIKSIFAHMELEMKEIAMSPNDIEERADMAMLLMAAYDRIGINPKFGDNEVEWAWGGNIHENPARAARCAFVVTRDALADWAEFSLRHVLVLCTSGHPLLTGEAEMLDAIEAKFAKNLTRDWPAPEDQVPGEPVEHIR